MTITEFWALLTRAKEFQLIVLRKSGEDLQGQGTIRVEQTDPSTIFWHEQGAWGPGGLAGIHFTNTTRWSWEADGRLQVSHQRRGPAPVLLSTLHREPDGSWTGASHLCGEDRYRPTVTGRPSGLTIQWEVSSPTDPYLLQLLIN